MKHYNKIRYYFYYLWWILVPLTITGILYDSLMSFIPRIEGDAINSIKQQNTDLIIKSSLIFLGLTIFAQINRFLKRYLVRVFSNKMNYLMRNKCFNHMLSLDMVFYKQNKVGDILNKNTTDISDTCESIRKLTTEIFDTVILMIGYIVSYFLLDYKIALMSLPFVLISIIISLLLKKKVYMTTKDYKEYSSKFKDSTLNMLKNEIYFRGMGVNEKYIDQYSKEVDVLAKKNVKNLVYKASMESIYSSIGFIGLFFVLYFGLNNVIDGTYDIGTFTTILTTFVLIANKGSKVGKSFNAYQGLKVTWKRIKPFLEDDIEIEEEYQFNSDGLSLIDFSYSYDDFKTPTITYSFNKDEKIGIVGRVHTGKSTLLKSLTGLYEYDGEAKLNGIDLKDLFKSKNQVISYCPSKESLFKDSIANNIELGRDGNIKEALNSACLTDSQLDINTEINPTMVNISGGQKQRLMLARSLYHQSNMYLLDNPFSSLERSMSESISNQVLDMNGLFFIVTNDENILKKLDRIIYLNDGIAKIDTYFNLLKDDSFKSLVEGDYDKEITLGIY